MLEFLYANDALYGIGIARSLGSKRCLGVVVGVGGVIYYKNLMGV